MSNTLLLKRTDWKKTFSQSNTEKIIEQTYFRGNPISWVVEERYITKTIKNAFNSNDLDKEEVLRKYNLIEYNGKRYERSQFLKEIFADYQKYQYKVIFKTENVFYLGNSQRAKLQYYILSKKFRLVTVAEQDKEELRVLCKYGQSVLSQQWYNRMIWNNGLEYMISFGVALEVKGKTKDVWCYHSIIKENQVTYCGINITWEEWELGITRHIKPHRTIRDNTSRLYYQDGKYLTLPQEQKEALENWLRKYVEYGSAKFPYSGIIPNGDLTFTIDFEEDIEIVPSFPYALKYKEQMIAYNKENNIVHNREVIGRRKVEETFSRLTGNEWTTAQIREQGFNDKNIAHFVEYRLIERIKRGQYKRIYK